MRELNYDSVLHDQVGLTVLPWPLTLQYQKVVSMAIYIVLLVWQDFMILSRTREPGMLISLLFSARSRRDTTSKRHGPAHFAGRLGVRFADLRLRFFLCLIF